MEWKKVNDRMDLPRDRQFLALWKGIICLAEFDEEEGRFYIIYSPSINNAMQIPQDREHKFYYWRDLPDYPDEYK